MSNFNDYTCNLLCEMRNINLKEITSVYSDFDEDFIKEELYNYLITNNINEGISDHLSKIKNWFTSRNIVQPKDINNAQQLENFLKNINLQIFEKYINEQQANRNYPILRSISPFIKKLTNDELNRIITFASGHRSEKDIYKSGTLDPNRLNVLGKRLKQDRALA